MSYLETLSINLITAILILAIGYYVARLLQDLATKILQKRDCSSELITFCSHSLFALVVLICFIAALHNLGLATLSIVTFIGIGGIAICLMLQNSLRQLGAGLQLSMLKPFNEGDYIACSDIEGKVQHIDWFNTTLVGADNPPISIPNTTLINHGIRHLSAVQQRHIELTIDLPHNNYSSKLQQQLLKTLTDNKQLLTSPSPTANLINVTEHGVQLNLHAWVNASDYDNTRNDLMQAVHKIIKQQFPH